MTCPLCWDAKGAPWWLTSDRQRVAWSVRRRRRAVRAWSGAYRRGWMLVADFRDFGLPSRMRQSSRPSIRHAGAGVMLVVGVRASDPYEVVQSDDPHKVLAS